LGWTSLSSVSLFEMLCFQVLMCCMEMRYERGRVDVTPPTLRPGVLAFVSKSWDETDRISLEI